MSGLAATAMSGGSRNMGQTISMGAANARGNGYGVGAADYGTNKAAELSSLDQIARQHYVTPTPAEIGENPRKEFENQPGGNRPTDLPNYYNNYNGAPVPYAGVLFSIPCI